MKFDSENYEPRKFEPVKPGKYAFSVVNATEGVSKSSGRDMITLELAVQVPGKEEPVTVYDYLFTYEDKNGNTILDKIASFCEATGLLDQFKAGEVTDVLCVGVSGKAQFKLEPDKNGNQYLKVHYYLKPEGFSESPAPSTARSEAHAKIAAQREKMQTQPAGVANQDIPF